MIAETSSANASVTRGIARMITAQAADAQAFAALMDTQARNHTEQIAKTYEWLLISQREGLVASHLRQNGLEPYLVGESAVVRDVRQTIDTLNCSDEVAKKYIVDRLMSTQGEAPAEYVE